jgi:hypothetical protein
MMPLQISARQLVKTPASQLPSSRNQIQVDMLLDQAPEPDLKRDWYNFEGACACEIQGDYRSPATTQARQGQLDFQEH